MKSSALFTQAGNHLSDLRKLSRGPREVKSRRNERNVREALDSVSEAFAGGGDPIVKGGMSLAKMRG